MVAKPAANSGVEVPLRAYSIRQFCAAHQISESFYYKIRNQGLGPREMRTGDKVTISEESAADWRRSREEIETV